MNKILQDCKRCILFLDERRAVPFWILLFFVLVAVLQLTIPFPADGDTSYHFAVGRLIREHGILKSFPWTPFSWQFDHYADKEFIFHLLFVPLAGLDLVDASRIVGVFCGTLILSVLFLVLRSEQVRLAGVWALLPLGTSAFVFRFAQVRPHLLSITLALLLIWAYARGRRSLLAVAALLYPLAYVAFWQIPLILIVAVESARNFSGEKPRWKSMAIVLASLCAGLLLHPNTVHLLEMNWIHMADILFKNAWGEKTGFLLGQEFAPYPLDQWVQFLTLSLLMLVGAFVLAWRDRRSSSVPLAFAIAAALFCLLTMKSGRFSEYFIPFAVVATALATRNIKNSLTGPLLLGISIACTLLFGTYPYRHLFSLSTKNSYIDPGVVKTLQETIPKDAQVFTCGWDYTGGLMLALPDRRFIVALDPTLMYKKDPQLYKLWYDLVASPSPDAAEVIRTRFGSRYVVCPNFDEYESFFNTLYSDPTVATYTSDRWLFFDLEGTGVQVLR